MNLHSPSEVGPRELRAAFGCFPTGVTIATCRSEGLVPVGVTLNSFVSVSLDPPIVSISLGITARCLSAFLADDRFAVHVLTACQLPLARILARPSSVRWESIAHRTIESGHVLLPQFVAAFLCERLEIHRVGDHVLLFGRVQRLAHDASQAPLTFFHGAFGSLPVTQAEPKWNAAEALEQLSIGLAWG